LTAAGWVVQSIPDLNLYAGRGVALREFRLDSGSVDYLLLVDRMAVGVMEANQ
jgi:type I restriction enzyme R subunit